MIGRIFTVGGLTLVSRLTGFLRDMVLAAVLGAGPMADAFFVALRLPNHFRSIFAEGAFNAAFIPAYARIRTQDGADPARDFGDRVFTLLLATQVVLLALALLFTPALVSLLAAGLVQDPERYGLAVELTRITFPYLLLVTLVTLYGGILNALNRFAAAAAASILLNVAMIGTLAVSFIFPTPGHAAAWGVLIAGILEVILVGGAAWRANALAQLRWPTWDADLSRFFKALGPATVGSAGLQLALFADTFIASFLMTGALSALYYADRIAQLPIGVIGIAVGTVLLPEMTRRIAARDEKGARHAQNRAIELTLLLSIPCFVAFILVPELIMRALFMRGAFTAEAADAAGRTLTAYALGMFPFVLTRTATAPFFARGDTATPVKASLTGVAVNVMFKILLMASMAQVGLALATAIGAWINFGLLVFFAAQRGLLFFDAELRSAAVRLGMAGLILAVALAATELLAARWQLRDAPTLALLVAVGAIVYGGIVLGLFGRRWLAMFRRKPAA
jgi:putative peptidoglycan lipid II flippase